MRRRGPAGIALAVIVLLGSVSCSASDPVVSGAVSDGHEMTTPAPVPSVSAKAAAALLATLDREPRRTGSTGYDRDAFGRAWADVDGNGCNQRDDVLLRDAVPGTARVEEQGACDHDVLAGTWTDPYTGANLVFTDLKDLGQAQAIQIDHVVPLAEAWVSGASSWSPLRRLTYANDLDDLVAASGSVNATKGAYDPAAWRPHKGYQCAYAQRWIAVKHRWRLAVDPSEVGALAEMLGSCEGGR